tara:strand:+ start:4593 stop:4823 length:231 start_codon:yes stop_codon:yes gene_type:complete
MEKIDRECCSVNAFCSMVGFCRRHLQKLNQGKHYPRPSTIKLLAMGLARLDGAAWRDHAAEIKKSLTTTGDQNDKT